MDIASLVEVKRNPKIPDIAPGDTVRVSTRIVEGGKERIQVFQGVVLKMKRGGVGASFTVRHVAFGIGVERTFPLYSPLVEKVEVVRQGKVRRARLYYLRGLSGKAVRRKIKRIERKTRQVGEELLEAAPEEVMEPEEVMTEEALEAAVAEKAAAVVEGKAAEAAPVAEAVTEAPAAEEEAEPAAEKVAEPAAAEAPGEEKPEDKAAA